MTTVVEMKNVAKYFGEGSSKVKALDGVDLTINEGEFVAIVGPSGSGKSTMMNLIGCLDRPTSGKVKIAGEDLSKLNDKIFIRDTFSKSNEIKNLYEKLQDESLEKW